MVTNRHIAKRMQTNMYALPVVKLGIFSAKREKNLPIWSGEVFISLLGTTITQDCANQDVMKVPANVSLNARKDNTNAMTQAPILVGFTLVMMTDNGNILMKNANTDVQKNSPSQFSISALIRNIFQRPS